METTTSSERISVHRIMSRIRMALLAVLVVLGSAGAAVVAGPVLQASWQPTSVEHPLPAPVNDDTASPADVATMVLAGGCFWGVQGVFQHVKGVLGAESGYAGGDAASANYDTVSTGTTGHAESVRITYDPGQITFGQLLRIFFTVAHDPTQRDRQGPDSGTQYRSEIFAQTPDQQRIAQAYIDQLNRAAVFSAPIVTTVGPRSAFYPAEAYHQNFMNANPDYPYIAINDQPKLDNLKRLFPEYYRAAPVLVGSS